MSRRSQLNPDYARQCGETDCEHSPEVHVVYDSVAERYRGSIWCSCRKITVASTQQREAWAEADRDAKKLLATANLDRIE